MGNNIDNSSSPFDFVITYISSVAVFLSILSVVIGIILIEIRYKYKAKQRDAEMTRLTDYVSKQSEYTSQN